MKPMILIAVCAIASARAAETKEAAKKVPAEIQEKYLKLVVRSQAADLMVRQAKDESDKILADLKAKAADTTKAIEQEFQALKEEAKKSVCEIRPIQNGVGVECVPPEAPAEPAKKK